MRKFILLFSALVLVAACDSLKPEELEPFTLSMVVDGNLVFDGRPQLTIHVENPNRKAVMADATAVISTDKGESVTTVTTSVKVAGNASEDIVLTTDEDLAPGFYKARCSVNEKAVGLALKGGGGIPFIFGISPAKLVSAPDKQADFDSFWEAAKAELASIDMKAELTEIPSRSNANCKVYLVEMQSVPDSEGGDPVTVRGYYLEPQDGKKYPVLMHYYGYDDLKPVHKIDCPYGSSSPKYAELYLSTRGQVINNRPADLRVSDGKGDFVNIYGDWFAYNFGQRGHYYYRGAFMDCVQGIRFMATRSTSDMNNVFAEGSSQGGAFSYAAAALSEYPLKAIAPCVAFLGDFPDYFSIVSWPGNTARKNKGTMSDEEMFRFLSYFDTKNLATRITCSVIACSGLQDGTCPPHTNTAPFNNLQVTDKEMYYYPFLRHEIPSDWPGKYSAFFKARTQQ